MSDDLKLSVIGVDGKVRWLSKRDADRFIIEKGGQFISNPKEAYYPQYDQTSVQKNKIEKPADVKVFTVENANSVLGIITL